jgi:hypothetical protein
MTFMIVMERHLHDSVKRFMDAVKQTPDAFDEENLPNLETMLRESVEREISAETHLMRTKTDSLAAEVAALAQSQTIRKREHAKHVNNVILHNHDLRRRLAQRNEEFQKIELGLQQSFGQIQPVIMSHVNVQPHLRFLRAQCKAFRTAISVLRSDVASFSSAKLVLLRQVRVAILNYNRQHQSRKRTCVFSDLHREIGAHRKMNRTLKNALALVRVRDFAKVVGKRKRSAIARQSGTELTGPCSVTGTAAQLCESVRTAIREKEEEIEIGLKNMARRHDSLVSRIGGVLSSVTKKIDVSRDLDTIEVAKHSPLASLSRTMDQISQLRRSRIIEDYGRKELFDDDTDA